MKSYLITSFMIFSIAHAISIIGSAPIIIDPLPKCPNSAAEALTVSTIEDLYVCPKKLLRRWYVNLDCCIINIAQCNKIDNAFKLRGGEDICTKRKLRRRNPSKLLTYFKDAMKKMHGKPTRRILRKRKPKFRKSPPPASLSAV